MLLNTKMCNEEDARRHAELAELQCRNKDYDNARRNYLEAAGIYVLEAQGRRDDRFLILANLCYRKSRRMLGEDFREVLTKQELARRTLEEQGEPAHVADPLLIIRRVLDDV